MCLWVRIEGDFIRKVFGRRKVDRLFLLNDEVTSIGVDLK